MKLSFSTYGWHDLEWDDFVSLARDMRMQGIEIHDLDDARLSGPNGPFAEEEAVRTARALAADGISVCCLDARSNPADGEAANESRDEILSCIRRARWLRTPYVRLRARETGAGADKEDENVRALVAEVLPEAERAGVTLLIETAGIYADTRRLSTVLKAFACDSLCALWDVHHPYRFAGESPETTITNLGAYVKHVHLKDSVAAADGSVSYCLLGEGTLPLGEVFDALRSVSYDDFYSLEWDPAWQAELNDPSVVLAHFASVVKTYQPSEKWKQTLYKNRAGTGRYVWRHDELINMTFPQVLDRMVEEFPDQPCFKFPTLDYTRTYSQFRDDVDACARALISIGVEPGSKVAVWATNVPAWYIAFWATTKIRATLVTMNTAYKIAEAEYLLRQSDTHTLVMIDGYRDSNYVDTITRLCPELKDTEPGKPLHARRLPFLRNVVTVGFRMDGCLTWDELMARAPMVPKEEVRRRAADMRGDDVANMQYTSGTTGFPKGVMLTHTGVVNNGKCIGDRMDLSTADRMMIQVPMFHCFGMVLAMTAAMTHGATMCPLPYFSPKTALDCVTREKITCFHGVPTMFIAMLGHENFAKTDFSHMRTGIMAGSPCPIKVMEEVVEKMHMPEICITYGQTEASPATTMSKTTDSLELRVNTVGSAIYGVECKIVDPETGEEVPNNVDGEFCARGYNIMRGYYKMPEATANAIDQDGWLHSGDLARKLDNGYFKITGRIKDMIIRGGENIYPKEIEDFLYTNPKIKDVQVIGVPDKQYGEEIMACVILNEGAEATEDEIKEFCRTHMAKHKTPRYVRFVNAFPMNAAGKILKYKMRDDAVEYLKLQDAASIVTA